jgi:hypothetical protein
MRTSRRSQDRSAQAPRSTWQGQLGAHPTGRPSFRRKILGVQSRLAELCEHTDLGRSRIRGAQLGWQSRRYTKVLQDLGIKARRPQGGRFGAQMTNIAASHPVGPLYQGIGDLSNNKHTDHRGPTNISLNVSDLHGTIHLQAPRRIWQSSKARLPRKVLNRTYNHSAQETEI